MALWFDLKVNTQVIGQVEVQRLVPGGTPNEGDLCTYKWTVHTDDGVWTGELRWPYGNPWYLISAVLAELDEAVMMSGRTGETSAATYPDQRRDAGDR